jgi:uncharacterized repeat protein (TIGR01451 family)
MRERNGSWRFEVLTFPAQAPSRAFGVARLAKRLALAGAIVSTALSPVSTALATFPSSNWAQVNQNGFVAGQNATDDGSRLFSFDGRLYAFSELGLFRMDDPVARTWSQVTPPAQPAGPGSAPNIFRSLGSYLYAWDGSQLWWIAQGADPGGSGWQLVTSTGLGGASPFPWVVFNGNLYGTHFTAAGPFEIWRTPAIGASAATWERVVQNSFGDPTNNSNVDIMITFNNHVYAGTTTLNGNFGTPTQYGTGVEIWESGSGDSGSWNQVNSDGFGTMFPTPPCYPPGPMCTFPIHQVIGSAAVYQAPGAPQAYLYVGTKSHFGAEIWRYDGSGLSGWTNVTPSWAGPCQLFCGPGRNNSLAVFQNELWLGEGYPTGNIARYDGTTWTVEVPGDHPFDPPNGGTRSVLVFDGAVHAATLHYPGETQGDQVWRYTHSPADVTGVKTVSSSYGSVFLAGTGVTYVVVLSNASTYPQLDNPGDEFTDTLPAQLTLLSATATSGTANTAGNTVHWNGSIPAGSSVTITINATVNAGSEGATVTNQGTIHCDADGDGTNESSRFTDAPGGAGQADPTSFQVLKPVPVASQLGLALAVLALLASGALVLRRRQVAAG